jgi:microcystin-dependent protein
MAEVFLGSLMLVPYNFAPMGFALCEGQIMAIQQNAALFSLLGTTYGGDGVRTFGLPDLRSRIPIGVATGPSVPTQYPLGSQGGVESVALNMSQMTAHSHSFNAGTVPPTTTTTAAGNVMGKNNAIKVYDNTSPAKVNAAFSNLATPSMGGNQPHENRMPTIAMNWIIALQGIFPQHP